MTLQFHSWVSTLENKIVRLLKNLYTRVHCSLIHNSQKVETAQMSINKNE